MLFINTKRNGKKSRWNISPVRSAPFSMWYELCSDFIFFACLSLSVSLSLLLLLEFATTDLYKWQNGTHIWIYRTQSRNVCSLQTRTIFNHLCVFFYCCVNFIRIGRWNDKSNGHAFRLIIWLTKTMKVERKKWIEINVILKSWMTSHDLTYISFVYARAKLVICVHFLLRPDGVRPFVGHSSSSENQKNIFVSQTVWDI